MTPHPKHGRTWRKAGRTRTLEPTQPTQHAPAGQPPARDPRKAHTREWERAALLAYLKGDATL